MLWKSVFETSSYRYSAKDRSALCVIVVVFVRRCSPWCYSLLYSALDTCACNSND